MRRWLTPWHDGHVGGSIRRTKSRLKRPRCLVLDLIIIATHKCVHQLLSIKRRPLIAASLIYPFLQTSTGHSRYFSMDAELLCFCSFPLHRRLQKIRHSAVILWNLHQHTEVSSAKSPDFLSLSACCRQFHFRIFSAFNRTSQAKPRSSTSYQHLSIGSHPWSSLRLGTHRPVPAARFEVRTRARQREVRALRLCVDALARVDHRTARR